MARYDIGGMLARSGQAQGQQIASGFQQFGTGLGSMLTGIGTGLASRRERKEQEAAAQEAQALLKQYANDPAQLNALGQKYATEGNDALSKLFLDAAKTATKRQVAVLEEAGAQITATTERARTQGQLRDALMAAREREDTNAVRALSNRSMDPSEYLKSLAEAKKGSEAKGYKVEKNVIIDGKEKSVVEFFDAQGNFLNRKVIGEVATEEGEEGKDKPFMETKAGSDLYNAAVAENNTVTAEIQKFDSIITEAEKLADDTGTPIIGGALGYIRDFAVSDIAGLGDEITAFRTSLNEIQMQKALALLPKGPASDRDVQLALNASPDLKNYNEEERLAALRGMKKILEARKQYVEGKVRWMEVTNDANAVGYERYAEIKGFDRNIEDLKTKFPTAIKELDSIISEASRAKQEGDEPTYEALIREAEAIDANLVVGKDRFGNDIKGLGYIDTLKSRGNSRRLLDKTLENRDLTFEDISYV